MSAGTSVEIDLARQAPVARYHEVDVFGAWRREEVFQATRAAGQPLVLLDAEQHVRRPAAVSDEHRPRQRRLLGATGVLIELPRGDRRRSHADFTRCSNTSTDQLRAHLQQGLPKAAAPMAATVTGWPNSPSSCPPRQLRCAKSGQCFFESISILFNKECQHRFLTLMTQEQN